MYAKGLTGTVARRCGSAAVVAADALGIFGVTIGICALLYLTAGEGPVPTGHGVGSVGLAGVGILLLRVTGFLRGLVGWRPTGSASFARTLGEELAERAVTRAGTLLPERIRDRYVEEWRSSVHDALREPGAAWHRRAAEVLECLRAAVVLAVVLRLAPCGVSR